MLPADENQLKKCLASYINPDAVRKDILRTIEIYQGLYTRQDTYVFNDGTHLELVNLCGTIPVAYKGSTYNIPICIWVMDTHPNNAPLCYVKPTPDMSIKVSIFVDQNGKIYLPYLHDWSPNTSDLLGLINIMVLSFGEQPPVYAKPKANNSPYPTSTFMPVPTSHMPNELPYYPTSTGFGGYPPYPTNTNFNQPSYPPYMGYPGMTYGPGPSTSTSMSNATGTITDEHIRASLMSAIEDKLKRRMREQFSQNQAEIETLKRTHQELVQGKAKLEDILGKMEREQNELDKNITILQDKEQELEKAIARLANEESIDVDNAVTTTTPLFRQLLNTFAEEAATEDAIYYMGEALRQGVIDLDVFLKQVRSLSRKQFMLRATMQKCRQKAGFAG